MYLSVFVCLSIFFAFRGTQNTFALIYCWHHFADALVDLLHQHTQQEQQKYQYCIGIGLKFFESQVENFLSFFIQNVCCENVCERKRSCRHSPQLTHCLQVPKIEIWHLPCKTDMKNWKKGKYCASFKCLGFRQSNMFCYETFLFRKFGEKIEQKND